MNTFSHAIPSILFAAGAIDKGTFVAVEIKQAVKNFQNGNVVAILDTLSILTNGKFSPVRNKSGASNMRASVTDIAKASKTAFKRHGFALALLDIVEQDATEENGAVFIELAKTYTDELKSTYEASKPAKAPKSVLTPAPMAEAKADTTATATVQEEITVAALVGTMLDAIKAGMLDTIELEMLRAALSMVDMPLPATLPAAQPAIH